MPVVGAPRPLVNFGHQVHLKIETMLRQFCENINNLKYYKLTVSVFCELR